MNSYMELSYIFLSVIGIFSAFLVISAKNPIHRIAFLVIVFTISSFIFILLDFYFLGLTYIIVYVGAIAILFLFVIMMVNIPSGPNDSLNLTTNNRISTINNTKILNVLSIVSKRLNRKYCSGILIDNLCDCGLCNKSCKSDSKKKSITFKILKYPKFDRKFNFYIIFHFLVKIISNFNSNFPFLKKLKKLSYQKFITKGPNLVNKFLIWTQKVMDRYLDYTIRREKGTITILEYLSLLCSLFIISIHYTYNKYIDNSIYKFKEYYTAWCVDKKNSLLALIISLLRPLFFILIIYILHNLVQPYFPVSEFYIPGIISFSTISEFNSNQIKLAKIKNVPNDMKCQILEGPNIRWFDFYDENGKLLYIYHKINNTPLKKDNLLKSMGTYLYLIIINMFLFIIWLISRIIFIFFSILIISIILGIYIEMISFILNHLFEYYKYVQLLDDESLLINLSNIFDYILILWNTEYKWKLDEIFFMIKNNNIFNYISIIWATEYITITDISSLAIVIYSVYPLSLILIGISLWIVMIGIIKICTNYYL